MNFRYISTVLLIASGVTSTSYQFDSLKIPLSTSIVLAQTSATLKAKADELTQLGTQKLESNQFEAALKLFQQALTIYQSISDHRGEGLSLNSTGAIHYFDFKDMKTGSSYFTQALQLAQKFSIPEVEIKALINLGHIERNSGSAQQAKDYHLKSLALAQKISDCYLQTLSLENLGYDVLLKEGPLAANQYLEQGVDVFNKCPSFNPTTQSKYHKKAIDLLNIIGLNYFTQHSTSIFNPAPSPTTIPTSKTCNLNPNLAKGIDAYQQASTLAKQFNEPIKGGEAFVGIGTIYQSIGCFPEAEKSLQEARKTLQNSPEAAFSLGKALVQLSALYQFSPRVDKVLDKALEASQASLKIFRGKANSTDDQLEYYKYEAQSLSNIGKIYNDLGNDQTTEPSIEQKSYPERALVSYEEAIQVAKSALTYADTLVKPETTVNNTWINIQKNAIQSILQNACLQSAAIYDRLGQSGKFPDSCNPSSKAAP